MPTPSALARPIALWLWCVAGLVFAMVLVGGATRLTQSGLSIVEWRPITGAVPPLSQEDWQAEFAKYKTIPQYERLNRGMSLDEFKAIYWWEWGHRLLGRLIGVVFAVPFLWFLWRRAIDQRLAAALAGIFVLGGVQGAVGWWMVSSGLTERVSVSQYRLAFHLTLASLIYAALVAVADGAWPRAPEPAGIVRAPQRLRLTAVALLGLVIGQIFLGALVAGLHAGLIYGTWPLIDGAIVPPAASLLFEQPPWRNFFENTLTVQFDHRMAAYGIVALALFHAIDAHRNAAKPTYQDERQRTRDRCPGASNGRDYHAGARCPDRSGAPAPGDRHGDADRGNPQCARRIPGAAFRQAARPPRRRVGKIAWHGGLDAFGPDAIWPTRCGRDLPRMPPAAAPRGQNRRRRSRKGPDAMRCDFAHPTRPRRPSHGAFLPARKSPRSRDAQPSLLTWRARPKARQSGGTSRVITEPDAT